MPEEIVIPEKLPNDLQQHFDVLAEAMELFAERSAFRGDMWRQFPVEDKIRELRERVSRIEMARNMTNYVPAGRDPSKHLETMRREIRSDLIDIINYAAFAIKQIDEGAEL